MRIKLQISLASGIWHFVFKTRNIFIDFINFKNQNIFFINHISCEYLHEGMLYGPARKRRAFKPLPTWDKPVG